MSVISRRRDIVQSAAVSTPADIFGASLWAWWAADLGVTLNGSGDVSNWADQSGNGRDWGASTRALPNYGTEILNGHNTLDLRATTTGLVLPVGDRGNQADFSFYFLVKDKPADSIHSFFLQGASWDLVGVAYANDFRVSNAVDNTKLILVDDTVWARTAAWTIYHVWCEAAVTSGAARSGTVTRELTDAPTYADQDFHTNGVGFNFIWLGPAAAVPGPHVADMLILNAHNTDAVKEAALLDYFYDKWGVE